MLTLKLEPRLLSMHFPWSQIHVYSRSHHDELALNCGTDLDVDLGTGRVPENAWEDSDGCCATIAVCDTDIYIALSLMVVARWGEVFTLTLSQSQTHDNCQRQPGISRRDTSG